MQLSFVMHGPIRASSESRFPSHKVSVKTTLDPGDLLQAFYENHSMLCFSTDHQPEWRPGDERAALFTSAAGEPEVCSCSYRASLADAFQTDERVHRAPKTAQCNRPGTCRRHTSKDATAEK